MWIGITQCILDAEYERYWSDKLARATPAERVLLLAEREKARIEATEERRHQETLQAIREAERSPDYHGHSPSSPPPSDFLPGVVTGIFLGKIL